MGIRISTTIARMADRDRCSVGTRPQPGAYGRSGLRLRPTRLECVFDTLSDRLSGALRDLRGKGRLSDADIDATAREIRIALLEADVALPVVRSFIAAVKELDTFNAAGNPFLLPGIAVKTAGRDHFPIEQMLLQRWQGATWKSFGGLWAYRAF